MTAATKKFFISFATTAAIFLFLNLLPYLRTWGVYNADGYELIGFPFAFRRLGGFAGISEFSAAALMMDAIVCLAIALMVGSVCVRRGRQQSEL